MALNTVETFRHEYHFDYGTAQTDFVFPGTLAESWTADAEAGVQISIGIDTGTAAIHLGDRLAFGIDRLLTVEFLLKFVDWDANSNAYIGMGSAYNADPTAITAHAFFHIGGGTDGLNLAVQTDDGTNDLSQASGWAIAGEDWSRFVINFRSGIQSISPPSVSVGGSGSVQFAATRGGSMYHLNRLTAHMDMSNYTAGLQPMVALVQAGGAASPVAKVYCKSIVVEAEKPSA